MSSTRTRAGATAVLAAVVLVAGCSAGSSPTTAPSRSSSASPGDGALETSRCRVAGFVPSTRTVLVSQRRQTLYGSQLDLVTGTGVGGTTVQLLRRDVRPGAVVDSPRGVALAPAVLRATEHRVGGTSAAALPEERTIRRVVRNRTGRRALLALYLDARVVRTRWTARVCGGVTNDGTSVTVVRGRTTTVGPTAVHTVPCAIAKRSSDRHLAQVCATG